jgi:O-antigen/teichoic acid export membrane protein
LAVAPFDKLIFYALLILGVTVMNICINVVYCHRKFEEVKLRFFWNWRIFKEMLKFVGWAMVGNFSNMFYTQGINLMLNAFCGPAVNAARGIAVQVQGVVAQFAGNVQTAINPQILKSHAVNDKDRMYSLIIASSRLCFYLLFLISLPIFIETEFLLQLWLDNVPDYTVNFVRIILMCVLLDAFVNPMFTANLASGKLALYHGPLALLMYVFMFITYFSIKITKIPESVFISYFVACLIGYIMRIFILKKQVGLVPSLYIKRVLLPVALVVVVSLIVPIVVHHFLINGWVDFLITSVVSVISVSITVYMLGITPGERNLALSFVRNRVQRFKGK